MKTKYMVSGKQIHSIVNVKKRQGIFFRKLDKQLKNERIINKARIKRIIAPYSLLYHSNIDYLNIIAPYSLLYLGIKDKT